MTRKVIERRAINICIADIIRFFSDLNLLPLSWSYDNLIFLDEVGFDNRDMMRKRGYVIKGKRLVFRGEFTRKERCSLLCFLGANGIEEVFQTEGTFDRIKFSSFCRQFALSGNVHRYPGKNSVWILDGARIHCHPNIVNYLRTLGVYLVFLPAYCPFFNPIEIVFGNVKSLLTRRYEENSSWMEMNVLIAEAMYKIKYRNMRQIFQKCGYVGCGIFNPGVAFSQNIESFGYTGRTNAN